MDKLAQLKGHSSKYGCRMCTIQGTRCGRIYYYPILERYDPLNLPSRRGLKDLIIEVCRDNRKALYKDTGIRGYSKFLDVPNDTLYFPRSLP